jgi:hypothetical protein
MDDGMRYVQDTVWPMVQGMSGCVGMSMLADRDGGRCIVTTAWATEEAMAASAEMVRESRQGAAEALKAEAVDVVDWEIAALHRAHAAGEGACARVVWIEMDPARMSDMIDAFRMTLMPNMESADGFCSVSLMANRRTGRACWTVTFDTRESLEGSRERAMAGREQFGPATGAQFTDIAECEVVMAHLRVPEMA